MRRRASDRLRHITKGQQSRRDAESIEADAAEAPRRRRRLQMKMGERGPAEGYATRNASFPPSTTRPR
ncbi:MAG: hypothetical protein ACLT1W_05045 [Alistipes onderdonkii]